MRRLSAPFEAVIGPPLYIQEGGGGRFKYPTQSPAILIVLKAGRVVSALNALAGLLRIGHTVEMGVIFRTVDDFLAEIMFVEEAVRTGQPTADQQRFIEQFFAEETVSVEEMMASDTPGPRRVERRAIQASEARVLGEFSETGPGGRLRRIVKTIDDVYSKYVHGAYPTVMELYVGGDNEGFRIRGTLGTPHIPTFRRELAHYTHRSLNVLASIAHGLGLEELTPRLLEARRNLEASDAYQT